MTELEKAARMALEQLEFLNACYPHKTAADAITALTQALATTERKGEPVAALIRHRRIRTEARIAHDGKDHYSEWSEWQPATLSHARAVANPSNFHGLPPLWEMMPLYTSPQVPEIDYMALIGAAWSNHKYAQGTRGCVAFKHGAEWFRSTLIDAARKGE